MCSSDLEHVKTMTTLLVLSTIAVTCGAVLARTLWRSLHPKPGVVTREQCELLIASRSAQEIYRPMHRLLGEEDSNFLVRQSHLSPGIMERWRRSRRRVRRLYLRELQADFRLIYRACRILAARSQDPAFATLITLEAMRFHGQLLMVHVGCSLSGRFRVQVDVANLVGALDRLRGAMRVSLAAWDTPTQSVAG